MRFMIGYQLREDEAFIHEITKHRDMVHEVYFAWGIMASGRGGTAYHSELLPHQAIRLQEQQLTQLANQGIGMNLLLNANCYGADSHGKKLFMLANSGCLNFCSARQFHDNLVAHENEIEKRDNGAKFTSACSRFVGKEENRPGLLQHLNCVRPEEMQLFEPYVVAAKLATRVSPRPEAIVRAYMAGQYGGNLLELLEPSHGALLYPTIVDNSRLPADYCAHTAVCDKKCETCSYCKTALEQASVTLNDGGILDVNKCND